MWYDGKKVAVRKMIVTSIVYHPLHGKENGNSGSNTGNDRSQLFIVIILTMII